MVPLTNITGRLGNQLFQFAALFAYAKQMEVDYYFQNLMFFHQAKEEIRTMFSTGIEEPIDAVAVHIRRGGNPYQPNELKYSENPFYVNLCATDYYEKATALFPDDKFLIFTDDPIFVTNEWKLYDQKRMTLVEGGSDIQDMNKMAACKGHIIANSTFSWWGAWLSPNYPYNRVIAPNQWFADGIDRTVMPDHWEQI